MTGGKYSKLFSLLAAGIGLWIWFVKNGSVCRSDTDLTGKTVLITGANGGIGKQAAIGLAKRNANVIIACRNIEKCSNAAEEIKLSSENKSVKFMQIDLSQLNNVRLFARSFLENEKRLDILVNNAGTIGNGRTEDGFDLMFSVNVLGPFLLTNLLLPLMRNTSKENGVRIINVSSEAYKFGVIDFDNLNPDFGEIMSVLEGHQNYANNKLMINYLTTELSGRMKKENSFITTYSLHPGIISTNIGVDFMDGSGFFASFFRRYFVKIFSISEFYGAQTILYCCLQKGLEKKSGKYFDDLQEEELLPRALLPWIGARLWKELEMMLHIES